MICSCATSPPYLFLLAYQTEAHPLSSLGDNLLVQRKSKLEPQTPPPPPPTIFLNLIQYAKDTLLLLQ